jgi:MoaA/NifB/PqqE/SkfB family radical SAM enzyme
MQESPSNRTRQAAAIREKVVVVDHLPTELTVAATDRCNLRCVMCGTHHPQEGDNNAGWADFPTDLVSKIEGMTGGAERIQLHGGGGEPMMSRSFWPWVSLFSANEWARIEFNTNGLLLSPRNIDRLMDHRVGFICVSMDAATEETYRNIRGGDWARLSRNLVVLAAARRAKRPDLRLALNMTVMRDNAHEMPALVRLASELGFDEVQFYKLNEGPAYDWVERTPHGYTFDYHANLVERNADYVRGFLDEAIRLGAELGIPVDLDNRLPAVLAARVAAAMVEVADAAPTAPPAPRAPQYCECSAPWRWLNISAAGDVYPCCMAVAPLKNLRDAESLAGVWNGPEMQRLRGNIKANRIDPICKGGTCIYVMHAPAVEDPVEIAASQPDLMPDSAPLPVPMPAADARPTAPPTPRSEEAPAVATQTVGEAAPLSLPRAAWRRFVPAFAKRPARAALIRLGVRP